MDAQPGGHLPGNPQLRDRPALRCTGPRQLPGRHAPSLVPERPDHHVGVVVRPFQGETERGITIQLVLVGQHLHEGSRIAELADLAAKGLLTLRIAALIPTANAAEAHRRLGKATSAAGSC